FSSKLPWKETLSFQYSTKEDSSHIVKEKIDYLSTPLFQFVCRTFLFGFEVFLYFLKLHVKSKLDKQIETEEDHGILRDETRHMEEPL
ncbi:hypothetical protein H5410_036655, partial [Solanum commersonii]